MPVCCAEMILPVVYKMHYDLLVASGDMLQLWWTFEGAFYRKSDDVEVATNLEQICVLGEYEYVGNRKFWKPWFTQC